MPGWAALQGDREQQGRHRGSLDRPAHSETTDWLASTITTKDRLALVTVMIKGTPYVIVDICLRMLQPHELYRAQGFPADYIISHGADHKPFTKTEQVHMCGNSVSPPPMAALARVNDPWRQECLQVAP